MTTPPGNELNPYQASPFAEVTETDAGQVQREMLKRFRDQIHALGAFWIIIGGLVGVLGAVAARGEGGLRTAMLVLVIMGVFWIALGVLACLKKIWAVYVGLGLTYLSVLGNLVNLNLCGLIIAVVVILQAHRVIGWAKKMREAGIALDARPY